MKKDIAVSDGLRTIVFTFVLLLIFEVVIILCDASQTNLNAERKWRTFTSKDYPSKYKSDTTATWLIHADYDDVLSVIVKVIDFDNCSSNDYLQFYDGPSSKHQLLRQMCSPNTSCLSSSKAHIYIVFLSDDQTEGSGFKIDYRSRSRSKSCNVEDEYVWYLGIIFGGSFVLIIIWLNSKTKACRRVWKASCSRCLSRLHCCRRPSKKSETHPEGLVPDSSISCVEVSDCELSSNEKSSFSSMRQIHNLSYGNSGGAIPKTGTRIFNPLRYIGSEDFTSQATETVTSDWQLKRVMFGNNVEDFTEPETPSPLPVASDGHVEFITRPKVPQPLPDKCDNAEHIRQQEERQPFGRHVGYITSPADTENPSPRLEPLRVSFGSHVDYVTPSEEPAYGYSGTQAIYVVPPESYDHVMSNYDIYRSQ